MTVSLQDLRVKIDAIDKQMITLLAERFQLTEEVGQYKAEHQLPSQDAAREAQQFQKIAELSEQHGLNPEYASEIYRCIMDVVIARHQELLMKVKV
ncbi:chorismate mutase [Paenibacillus taihuensis]|uniref:Chorismate mutase n=1 Tax=Paenibacillus taihuensis TaxID=1156355 RepID=A0A3D9SFD1_9BACL|nr:chorismate mutase [Paenibacillus taihuensis]REE94612.1 chorismate mutase [Paenibacillus taihuensis]